MPRRFVSLGLALLLGSLMLALLAAATRQAAAAALFAPAGTNTYPSGTCNTSLQACINLTSAPGVITISAGTYVTSVTLNKAISLMGVNSATTILRALPSQRVITITGASIGSATIISGLTFANGHVLGAVCPAGCGGAIQITGSAQPLLQNLIISNSASLQFGGGLYANLGSPLTLKNVTLISNSAIANSGGGLFAGDALTLTNVTVKNNRAPVGAGGGVRASGTVIINDGLFQNNHSFNPGGAMRVTGDLTINGGSFISNTAGIVIPNGSGINGGGVRADANVAMFGTSFISNAVNNNGGGLYAVGTLQGFGLTVISNTAAKDGGGLYGELTADIGGQLAGNLALAGNGGALYARGVSNYDGAEFTANQAGLNGGGSYAGAEASSNGANYFRNAAGGAGGGLFAVGDGHFNGSELLTNTADFGGGAFVQGNVGLAGAVFQANEAQHDAGGLFVGLTATVFGPTLNGNLAVNGNGGGILVSGNITGIGPTVQQNEANNGGGLYISGSVNLRSPQLSLNVAHNSLGGGLLVVGPATIDRGSFLSNTAENNSMLAADQAPSTPGAGVPAGGGLFAQNAVTLTRNLFQGNQSAAGVGGGAMFSSNRPASSANDRFVGNSANTFGGGLHTVGPLTITAAAFSGNRAGNSAALDAFGPGAFVANSLFTNNVVTGTGPTTAGGILFETTSPSHLFNDTLANSSATTQTAVRNGGGLLVVSNTIVVGYGTALSGSFISEDHNLFFDNQVNVAGSAAGAHSLAANPLFVNSIGGDFHLTLASPARDTGVDVGLTKDFDGDPRAIGGGFDIGFDEFAFPFQLFLPLVER